MKRPLAALMAIVTVATLLATPIAVQAGTGQPPPWRWTRVSSNQTDVPAGTQLDVVLYCPAGYEPVSWAWADSFQNQDATTLTLQADVVDFDTYSGTLRVWNGTHQSATIAATLNCVYGAHIGAITTVTKVISHTVGNAGGFAKCPSGTYLLSGSAGWDQLGSAVRLDFMAPTSSGWYATGNATAWTGNLTIRAHCIASANAYRAHLQESRDSPDPDSAGIVRAPESNCEAGELAASAGAYELPDGGQLDPNKTLGSLRSVWFGPYGSWHPVSATSPNNTTTLVVTAICLPVSAPKVYITLSPGVPTSSHDVGFTFQVVEPVGYEFTVGCRINHAETGAFYSWAPCSLNALNSVTGVEDGAWILQVSAVNEMGRQDIAEHRFDVDTLGPAVTVDGKPDNPTSASTVTFHVGATDPHPGTTYCYVDDDPEEACPSAMTYRHLDDGVHVFHWRAVDRAWNETTGSYKWRVDTVAPTAGLTAPTMPFTPVATVTVGWHGSDSGSGIASWQVQWQQAPYTGGFGAWSEPQTIPGSTLKKSFAGIPRGTDSCYRVRAVDGVGHSSAFSARRCAAMPLDDWDLASSDGWVRTRDKTSYAGTLTTTTRLNATLTFDDAQLDRLALLATTCPTCGKVGVYVNATLVGTVDLHSVTAHNRQLIALPPFALRTGTVTLKVLTTGKLVRIDGLGVSRT